MENELICFSCANIEVKLVSARHWRIFIKNINDQGLFIKIELQESTFQSRFIYFNLYLQMFTQAAILNSNELLSITALCPSFFSLPKALDLSTLKLHVSATDAHVDI